MKAKSGSAFRALIRFAKLKRNFSRWISQCETPSRLRIFSKRQEIREISEGLLAAKFGLKLANCGCKTVYFIIFSSRYTRFQPVYQIDWSSDAESGLSSISSSLNHPSKKRFSNCWWAFAMWPDRTRGSSPEKTKLAKSRSCLAGLQSIKWAAANRWSANFIGYN